MNEHKTIRTNANNSTHAQSYRCEIVKWHFFMKKARTFKSSANRTTSKTAG